MAATLPKYSLGPSDPWARAVETLALGNTTQLGSLDSRFTAANQSTAATVASLWQAVGDLQNRAVRAAVDTTPKSVANAGTQLVINWFTSPNVGPSLTLNTPYSTVLVEFGGALSNTAGTTFITQSILGLRVNGTVYSNDKVIAVSSDQPSGGGAVVTGSLTLLVPVTPNAPVTFQVALGCRKLTTTSTGNAGFTDLLLSLTPVPDTQ